jgi:hypothetical protein
MEQGKEKSAADRSVIDGETIKTLIRHEVLKSHTISIFEVRSMNSCCSEERIGFLGRDNSEFQARLCRRRDSSRLPLLKGNKRQGYSQFDSTNISM